MAGHLLGAGHFCTPLPSMEQETEHPRAAPSIQGRPAGREGARRRRARSPAAPPQAGKLGAEAGSREPAHSGRERGRGALGAALPWRRRGPPGARSQRTSRRCRGSGSAGSGAAPSRPAPLQPQAPAHLPLPGRGAGVSQGGPRLSHLVTQARAHASASRAQRARTHTPRRAYVRARAEHTRAHTCATARGAPRSAWSHCPGVPRNFTSTPRRSGRQDVRAELQFPDLPGLLERGFGGLGRLCLPSAAEERQLCWTRT